MVTGCLTLEFKLCQASPPSAETINQSTLCIFSLTSTRWPYQMEEFSGISTHLNFSDLFKWHHDSHSGLGGK